MCSIYKHELYNDNHVFDEKLIKKIIDKYTKIEARTNKTYTLEYNDETKKPDLIEHIQIEEIYNNNINDYINKKLIYYNNEVYNGILRNINANEISNDEYLYIDEKGFRNQTIKESSSEIFFEKIKERQDEIKSDKFINKLLAYSFQDSILHKKISYELGHEFYEDLNKYIFDILSFDKELDFDFIFCFNDELAKIKKSNY